jgi:hypothetical protein
LDGDDYAIHLIMRFKIIFLLLILSTCSYGQMLSSNVLLTSDRGDNSTVLNFSPSVLSSLAKAGSSSLPTAEVTTNGEAIQLVYDLSTNSRAATQLSANLQPLLGSDGTRNSYLTFDGTNDYMTFAGTQKFFNNFHSTNPRFCWYGWIKFNGGDGVTQRLYESVDGVTSNVGIQFLRANTNKILIRACRGVLADFVWTVTSATSVLAATGWVAYTLSINGTGTNTGEFRLYNSSGTLLETTLFNVAATGTSADATTSLIWGSRLTPDLYANASFSDFKIRNKAITAGNISELLTKMNPVRRADNFTPWKHFVIDFNNSDYIFSNTGGTVEAVNNDPIRMIRNNMSGNFGDLMRNLTTTSSGTSPLWKTNILNGLACAQWDGTDDNFDFENTLFGEQGGKWTMFFVMRNDDATFGSHLMSGNNYVVLTGSGYSGASPPTTINPYSVVHPDPAGTQIHTNTKGAGVDGFKVIAFRRNLSVLDGWNGDKTKSSSTSNSRFSITDMGVALAAIGSDWNLHGYVAYIAVYKGVLTDAQVESIIDKLNTRTGL